MLLEHDAKGLLEAAGLSVPQGVLVRAIGDAAPFSAGVIKAQVPVGGRAKAGGVKRFSNEGEFEESAAKLLALTIKGHKVRALRAERAIEGSTEVYVSLALNPAGANVTVLVSAEGGVDIEHTAGAGALLREEVPADGALIRDAVERLATKLSSPVSQALLEAGPMLADFFVKAECLLLEINPLFVSPNGKWVVGDAKIAIDDSALARQPELLRIVEEAPDLYPEASMKLAEGFDYVELDPHGDIGLITTGAGLSMQIVDELMARGRHPFNFCDIRTGQFRGDPSRLIQVMRWISRGQNIEAVLINFFAGHTDLGEIAHLLVAALGEVPELSVPITARLIGNGFDEAQAVLAAAQSRIHVETELDRALDRVSSPHV